MRRLIIIASVLVAVIAALAWVALRETPVTVDFVTLKRGDMQVTVDIDGRTRIREVFEVSAPIAGTALRSPVRVGDEVKAGTTVVAKVLPGAPSLLDARSRLQAEAAVREAEAAVDLAERRVEEAEQELAYADNQLARAKELVQRGVASLTRLEDADQQRQVRQAARDTAISSRAMAKGALDRARAALIEPALEQETAGQCCVEIKAPVDGRVLSIESVSERPVLPGTRLLAMGAPNDLEIIADPLSRDAMTIPPGAIAYVERWGGTPLQARLRRIDPSAHTEVSTLGIEEQRVEALFDITSPHEDWAQLGDGYAVYLRVVTWEGADTLMLPLGALFRRGEDWAVFKVADGRARLQTIAIGRRNATDAEVLSGLEAGDVIVSYPSDNVSDGVLVEAARRE